MDDERHIVTDCPKCRRTIWTGVPCPTCFPLPLAEPIEEPDPLAPEPEKPKKQLRGGLDK